jgi:Ca-activated chloride channel homolog
MQVMATTPRDVRFLLAAVLLAGVICVADDQPVQIQPRAKPEAKTGSPAPRSNIRVDTTLVQIPVSVTDPLNRFVTGLEPENFRIYEDKIEQKIVQFASEDAPLAIGILFDCSSSMGRKLEKSRQAVAQFLKTANPDDEFFLIEFSDNPTLVTGFTKNISQIQNQLTFLAPKGRTALLDGLYMGMDEMKKAKNPRKAILVISDGGDNNSRYTEGEIKRRIKEADVQIYAIGIYEPVSARGRTAEELSGPSLLTEIAEQTGGRQFPAENLNELPDIAAKIGLELRNQYVLFYSPGNRERDGKYRRVQVKIVQPKEIRGPLRAHWRTGYYAPTR